MMHLLDETSCTKGAPLRSLWTADEARMVKRILNNLTVRQRSIPSTEIERDPDGNWTIWIPIGEGGASTYNGFFKLTVSGGVVTCSDGYGYVNGTRVYVGATHGQISNNQTLSAWIEGSISADGEKHLDVKISNSYVPTADRKGLAILLAGTVTTDANGISTIIQQQHGEAVLMIYGECGPVEEL